MKLGPGPPPPSPPQRGSGQPLHILPDGESPGLLLDLLPRRVRNRSLTNLASSSSARFFFLSSSEMLMSGSWSFTRSMTCPAGSAEGGCAQGESPCCSTRQPRDLPGAAGQPSLGPALGYGAGGVGAGRLPRRVWPLCLVARGWGRSGSHPGCQHCELCCQGRPAGVRLLLSAPPRVLFLRVCVSSKLRAQGVWAKGAL